MKLSYLPNFKTHIIGTAIFNFEKAQLCSFQLREPKSRRKVDWK